MTYTVAIIPGAILKSGELRIETFLDKADSLKFDQLNLEAICMLRRLVTPRIMATFELDEIEVYGYFGYPSNLIILGEERNQPNLCIGYSDPRRLSSPTTGMAFLSGAMKDPGLLP